MASNKRHFAEKDDDPHSLSKKAKESESESESESVASPSSLQVLLNPADYFNIDGNGLVRYGLHEEGFAYYWSGARAKVGITRGRYCFACKVVSAQTVNMEDTAPEQQHICCLGISRGDNAFGVGDTIVCCVDLESKPLASIGFSKTGKLLGAATQFDVARLGVADSSPGNLQWTSALFPHVLLKNVVVQMQFSVEDGLVP
ncbi:hypothetical protein JHK82_037207 [Glycine max]|nr:hypothetical protein JHK85_037964 [Glycine max]KAG5113938.1 hypothetical protein JHK82_037207 [Glycine max]